MTRRAKRGMGTRFRGWLAILAFGVTLVPGCSMFRREPLEVPPGHQAVMGEIVVTGFA